MRLLEAMAELENDKTCAVRRAVSASPHLRVNTDKTDDASVMSGSVHTLLIGQESFVESQSCPDIFVDEEELDKVEDDEEDDNDFDDSEAMQRMTGFGAPIRSVMFIIGLARWAKERARIKHIVSSEGILTTNDDSDDEDKEELAKQGNLDFYTTVELQKRKQLMKSSEIKTIVQEIWDIEDLIESRDAAGTLGKKTYTDMLIKMHYLVMPVDQVDPQQAKVNAEVDWSNDTNGGGDDARMSWDLFFPAMFQIADTWSNSTDLNEYVAILQRVLVGITSEVDRKRKMKTLDQIKHDQFFQKSAKRKYKSFMNHMVKKKKKLNRLSKSATHVAIGKLYHAKIVEDEKNKKKGIKCTRFDKFIFAHYMKKYGTKKLARRQTKRLVASIMHYGHKEKRFRLFGKLAGIRTRPVEGEQIEFEYDPMFCSDYFLPLLSYLMNVKDVERNFSGGNPLHVLKFTYLIGMQNRCAQHTPKNSTAMLTVLEKINSIATLLGNTEVASPSTSPTKSHSTGTAKGKRQSILVGAHRKSETLKRTASVKKTPTIAEDAELVNSSPTAVDAHHSRGLRSALKKRLAMTTLAERYVLDLDDALLIASELWKFERMWHRIYRHVIVSKAAAKWMKKVKSKPLVPNKHIRALAAAMTKKKKIDRTSMIGVATATKAALACEALTGVNFRELVSEYSFHSSNVAGIMAKRKSTSDGSTVDASRADSSKSVSEPESDPAKTASCDPDEKSKDMQPAFQPSPRSPRVVLEAAKARDAAINNSLYKKKEECEVPVVAVEPFS